MSLESDVNGKLPDNNSGEITPAKAREAFGFVIDNLAAPREQYTLVGNNPTMKMEIEAAGTAAQMQVIDKATGHNVASMQYDKVTKSFSFILSDPASGVQKAFFQIKQDGNAYVDGKKIILEGELERPTVVSAYTNTPTKAELITAAKLLPHYTNDAAFWSAGHDFYVRDDPQTKMLLVKYRGTPANVDEATAGNFFFEKITKAA